VNSNNGLIPNTPGKKGGKKAANWLENQSESKHKRMLYKLITITDRQTCAWQPKAVSKDKP